MTSLQTDLRRTARDAIRKPGRPPLEMPVLFQLADWSLPHAKSAPPKVISTPPTGTIVAEPIASPAVIVPPVSIADTAVAVEPPDVEVAQKEAPGLEAHAAVTPKLEIPQGEQPSELIVPAIAEANAEDSKITLPVADAPGEQLPIADENTADTLPLASPRSDTNPTDVTPPQEKTAPTPLERSKLQTKSRHGSPSNHNDWMRTHGRYIAVGFVIALIATIYTAQNGDEPAPANPNAAATSKEEVQTTAPSETESKVTDAHTAKESVTVSEHQHSPSQVDETSPASGSPLPEAHADLHTPRIDNAIKEPVLPAEVADSRSLFPWKEAGESRVVSKPEDHRAKQAERKFSEPSVNAKEAATFPELPQEEPSVYGPPSGAPQQPAIRPAAGETPPVNAPDYPVTNPGNYRDFEPPQGGQPSAAQPRTSAERASPASYQPGIPNNVPPSRTSGPRHERTGSGLY